METDTSYLHFFGTEHQTVLDSYSKSGTGTQYSSPFTAAGVNSAALFTKVTASTGAPDITVALQVSPDGEDWVDIGVVRTLTLAETNYGELEELPEWPFLARFKVVFGAGNGTVVLTLGVTLTRKS